MQFRRAVLVVIFIALLGSAFLVSQPVQAQGTVDCSYPQFWDFKQGLPAGFTMTYGVLTPDGIGPELIDASTKRIELEWECTADVGAPRGFNFGFWSNSGWAGARPYDIYHYNAAGSVIYGPYGQGAGAAGYSLWGPISWSAGDTRQNTRRWKITYQWGTGQVFYFQSFDINNWEDWQGTPTPTPTPTATPIPIVPGTGAGWSYPVAQRDRPLSRPELYRTLPVFEELELENLTETVPSALMGLSLSNSANVHAVLSGEITAITSLSGLCINQGSIPNMQPGSCQVSDPEGGITDVIHLLYQQAQLITQDVGDGRVIRYVVAQPRVRVGDVVEQDCILGQTLPLTTGYPVIGESQAGWTLLEGLEGSEPFDLLTPLSQEPEDISCRAEPSPQCSYVRNPDFQSTDFWELGTFAGQTATIALGGGLVPTGYAVQRDIFLDPETEYAIIVRHIPEPGASSYSFSVELGTTTHTVDWIPSDGVVPQDTVITAQTYEPLVAGGLYDLSISGLANAAATTIDFICIFDPDAELPQPTGGCLLFNHEFDQDSASWSSSGVVVWGGGLARVLDEGTISQALRLSPKDAGPQSYTLSVRARRAGVYAADETIDLGWEWSTFSGALAGFTTTTGSNFQEKTASFTVSGAATDDLVLTVDADDSSAKSLHIDRVCITTNDGTIPPGYLDPPTIEANCKICVYEPVGDMTQDLSELVGWLGCMLLSLWECSVKSVLVGMWNTLTAILVMFGYFRMWLSLSFSNFAEFANSGATVFAQYLGSELWNLGTRIQNTLTSLVSITQIQTGNAGIWDVLLALINQLANTIGNVISGVLSPLIDLLRDFIGGIFGLVAAAVNLVAALLSLLIGLITGVLATLLGTALGIVQAIINGINMTPVAPMPEWLISCGDPLSGTFAPDNQLGYLCLGIWMMEQKFRSGPAQYFIPIFIGLASLALLMWGVQRILGTLAGLGGGGDGE